MSHSSHPSDRFAAYRWLIVGAIAVAALIVTIVKLVNAKYAAEAPAKTGSASFHATVNRTLDV